MKRFIVVDWLGDVVDEFDKEEDAVECAKETAKEDSEQCHIFKWLATARVNVKTEIEVKDAN